jgi:hypothetical protein
MELTPKDIYEDFKNNRINKIIAYNQLTSLIEGSENEDIRFESIMILEKIDLINDKLFNFLENLLISDLNRKIRNAAAEFIMSNFLEKAINPLKWVISHEKDYECLITIIKSLEKINTYESKSILVNEIQKIIKIKYINKEKRIRNKKFQKVIKRLLKTKEITNFTHKRLAEILINYLTISNLTKQYPNVYFELDSENGLVRELDLSDYLEYEVKGIPFGWKNNIKSISEIPGLNHLKYLKKFDLSNNQIDNVKDLSQLENLTHLILNNNKISKKENLNYLKRLSNLEYLDLRGNELGNDINPGEFNPKIKVLLKNSYLQIK